MSTFGKRIIDIRKEKGLSQGDLAKQIGIMGVVLGRYERDEVKPSIEVAAKISDALGVSLDYLVGNSEVRLDKDLIKRITEIQQLSEADRQGIFFALDGLLVSFPKVRPLITGGEVILGPAGPRITLAG
ncbi:MAG: helix-turn-helix domain-containing protein, partial [Flavobacteriales bacterium]